MLLVWGAGEKVVTRWQSEGCHTLEDVAARGDLSAQQVHHLQRQRGSAWTASSSKPAHSCAWASASSPCMRLQATAPLCCREVLRVCSAWNPFSRQFRALALARARTEAPSLRSICKMPAA